MRRRCLWSGVALSCVVGFSDVRAQPSSSGSNQQGTITVTGCLQQGGAGGTLGTTGGVETSGSAGPGGQYVLTHATMVTSGKNAAGTPGSPAADRGNPPSAGRTVPPTGAGGDGKYILDGAKTDLQPHIGHQVEIVGRMVNAGAGAQATTSPTGGSASANAGASGTGGRTATSAGTSAEGPRLQVQAVRMTSSDCAAR